MSFFKQALQPLGYDLSGIAFSALSKTWLLQREYHWQLFMPHLINGVFGPFISVFCQDVRFGDYSISSLGKIQQGAFQRFYAGLQDISSINLTFITSVDNAVLDYFYGWYHLAIDEQGYYYPKNHYKKNIYVALYDRSGVESVRFNMKGVFPKNKPPIGVSYGSEGMLKLNVVLSVDIIEMFSMIGSIRGAVTNVIGSIAKQTKEMLGSVPGGSIANGVVTKAGNVLFGARE